MFIPFKTTKLRDSQPWTDRKLKHKIRLRDRAFKQCKKRGSEDDEKKLQQLNRGVQREQRKAYWQYVENLFTPLDDHSQFGGKKKFYKFIKHKKSDYNGVAALKVDGRLVNDSKGKADVLNQHFESVFSRTSVTFVNMTSPFTSVPTMVTVPGVLKLLNGLNPNKACGPDNIGPMLLGELSEQIASPPTTIFQLSLHDGIVPGDCPKANITPVFKKGQRYQCSNYYRPISLTCVVSKLMEHVVCCSIMNHANMHNILYPLQHGLRVRRSCETQLIDLVNDIANNMQSGLETDICVLDFAKAFLTNSATYI